MSLLREKTVAFTGYRTAKILRGSTNPHLIEVISTNLENTILSLVEQGHDTFISGMSEGFDLLAARAVVKVRINHPTVKLIATVPFIGQESSYSPQNQELYRTIYNLADRVELVSVEYHQRAYLDRNDYMLAHSSTVICYYDGQPGGTMHTYNRAVKLDMPIINLCLPVTP